jgi:hypothetical protein
MMSRMPTPNEQVSGPATGLMITAILGFVAQVLGIIMNVFGFALTQGLGGVQGPEAYLNFFSGTMGLLFNVIGIGIAVVVLMGALKMKRLESHGFSMVASILALVPCISPCCLIGIPMGIWSLVVLLRPEVKGAFR